MVITSLISKALKNDILDVWGDGSQYEILLMLRCCYWYDYVYGEYATITYKFM